MSTSSLPIISVEDTTSPETGLSNTTPEQPPQLTAPDESMVQPGIQIDDLDLPPPLEGKLTKIQPIGWGGYSEVHRGIWTDGGKDIQVGIKCLRPRIRGSDDQVSQQRFETRIRRETVIWQRARHENILPFIGYQIVDGVSMLVSPWCENSSLDVYVNKHPDMTDCKKLELLCDAAQGLAHLHSLQLPVVHGDIKPDNVLVTDKLRGALVDFGISRLMVGLGMRTGLTTAGGAGGTAGYQARELMLNHQARPTDKSDVYSFGGLILATLSGQSPFHHIKTDAGIVLAVAGGQTPIPTDHLRLAPEDPLWSLMRECWSSEPAQRPFMTQTIDELKAEMQRRSPSGSGSV